MYDMIVNDLFILKPPLPLCSFPFFFYLNIFMIIQRESVLCQLRLVPVLETVCICFTAVSALTLCGGRDGDKLSYVLWESLSEK